MDNSINGDIHRLQGTASSMARTVSESTKNQDDKEIELRKGGFFLELAGSRKQVFMAEQRGLALF